MPINDTLETLKNQLSGSVKTVLPSQGIPSKRSGSAPSSLTAWTEITFYEKGGPRPGRTIGRGGDAGETWVLPLPQDLSDVNSFEYEPIEFGGTTMFLDSVYNAITLGMDKGNTTQAKDSSTGFGELKDGAVAGGMTALDLIGAENAKNAVRAKARQTANPNLEALFKSSNLRTFQFSWNITPLTEGDSQQLSEFVSTFKKSIYPGSGSLAITGNAAQLLFFPYEFVVSFYSQGIQGGSNLIFSTAACACTDFTVQYTPNGAFNTHIDGKPTALSMNATFQEMYILSRNDVEQLGKKY
jgi:hypothetical protein